jgi:hypothetical protein
VKETPNKMTKISAFIKRVKVVGNVLSDG